MISNYYPTKVQPITKPLALTTADYDRLDAADAYYAYAGHGYWTFSQACSEPTCKGYWTVTIHESDPLFEDAKARACKVLPCRECAPKLTGATLITYAPKSASAGGSGNGNGKGGKVTRRKQPGQRSAPRTSYAQQMAAAYGWTLLRVGHRYYMTKEGEQARSFSNLDQVLDFVQAQAKARA